MNDFIDAGAIKVIEVIGISTKGFEDAVQHAVRKASQSISGITGVEVVNFSARVQDGEVVQYKADTKLAFVVK